MKGWALPGAPGRAPQPCALALRGAEPDAARGAADEEVPVSPTVVPRVPLAGCRLSDLFAEAYRLHLLRGLEELLAQCGFARIAGVDEVGRGSLAGPVVAAAVIVDPCRLIPGVDDSKCLTAPERERLAAAIRATALGVAVAQVSPDVIDRINILEATRLAMRGALAILHPQPDCALVDAVGLGGGRFPCLPVVRGDAISYAVACASIVAKVERDQMMVELGYLYPQYGFAAHKGYSVPEHLRALEVYGPCPIHRLSFRKVLPRVEEGRR
ncbi:MAG: ribonuclease HII [Acidobacteriota bacterium]|nr:ribonuclease HII [Acidobacteriota bacterium]